MYRYLNFTISEKDFDEIKQGKVKKCTFTLYPTLVSYSY